MTWGFGIPATKDRGRAATIAAHVEDLGFDTIWTNDLPRADGIRTASFMAESTRSIRVGIGVVPCDRRPPGEIAAAVKEHSLPLDRVVLGIGAGSSSDPLNLVRGSLEELRGLLGPTSKIGIAAMGSRMCELAGELADVVLLNWMVPQRIWWARRRIERSTAGHDALKPEVAAYVRVALGAGGRERIREEGEKYYAMPAYRRHFRAMGEDLSSVGIAGSPATVVSLLPEYSEVLDEVVVRALPASDLVESTLAVAEATAPARWV